MLWVVSYSLPCSVRNSANPVRRVGLVNGLLGGAGLGGAIGAVSYYVNASYYTAGHGALGMSSKRIEVPTSGEKPIPVRDVPNMGGSSK